MLDGKYSISLNTPIGPINGNITLITAGENVSGILETMGMKNNFLGKKIDDSRCQFKGNFNSPLGNIQYTADCVINGNNIELVANSNKGNFKLQGKRL